MDDLDIANERMIAGERLDCFLQRLRNRSYSSKLSTCSLNVSDAARSVRTWLKNTNQHREEFSNTPLVGFTDRPSCRNGRQAPAQKDADQRPNVLLADVAL
jgi:hypothetical protein